MPLTLTETKDLIGTVVIDHLQKRNAFSETLIGEITIMYDSHNYREGLNAFQEQHKPRFEGK